MYQEFGAESLIEIGPGKGSLTKLIKDVSSDFWLFEKDETLKEKLGEVLKDNQNYTIIWGDVLEADLAALSINPEQENFSSSEPPAFGSPLFRGVIPGKTLVVGNLPYYITSPILRKFFCGEIATSQSSLQGRFLSGLFMIQDEVGQKIRHDAQKKSYLYWLLNYGYEVSYLKTVPAKAFTPAPKVRSCMVGLYKKSELPQIPFDTLVSFLDDFSPYSRKTLGKIMKMLEKRDIHYALPVDLLGKRLEELHWKDMEKILS
ncbi:MAG: rRNA adenine N-6-methyltransferase family protein [Candidatus Absconditabacteria bacterium]|nr:rRNA adenine N-6-methyltransferase family protein [Candidatus Absconditabacteria bacterium]MDD3868612.1 rRNA adenine N-6-methyltransferase family protein [Candidatus Absconditabacteria bacterium]MDD4714132.1 rRNA adenine N-6-methyltransferase family protein [Candidatus Absconditabacteria bacterium]